MNELKEKCISSARGTTFYWTNEKKGCCILVKGAAHNANEDSPEDVNRIIRDFLQTL